MKKLVFFVFLRTVFSVTWRLDFTKDAKIELVPSNLNESTSTLPYIKWTSYETFDTPISHFSTCGTLNVLGGPGILGPTHYKQVAFLVDSPPHYSYEFFWNVIINNGYTSWTGGNLNAFHKENGIDYTCSSIPINNLSNDTDCSNNMSVVGYCAGNHNANKSEWGVYQNGTNVIGMDWSLKSFLLRLQLCDEPTCLQCKDSCDQCFKNSICIACDPNAKLMSRGLPTAYCKCNSGYKMDGYKCLPICNDNCISCSRPNECILCSSGFYLGNSGICLACHNSCSKCIGPSKFNCTECSLPYDLVSSQCIIKCESPCLNCSKKNSTECLSCQNGYYLKEKECMACHPSCSSCEGGSLDECIECATNFYFVGTHCVISCSSGTYPEKNSSICKPCDTSCAICNGPLVSDCLECPLKYFLSVPPGPSKCLPCDKSCASCFGNSTTDCITCATNYSRSNSLCLHKCPPGNYIQEDPFACKACDNSCETCVGPLSSECISCNAKHYLSSLPAPSSCLPVCYNTCATCFGGSETECLTCISGYFFHANECLSQAKNDSTNNSNSTQSKLIDFFIITNFFYISPGWRNLRDQSPIILHRTTIHVRINDRIRLKL